MSAAIKHARYKFISDQQLVLDVLSGNESAIAYMFYDGYEDLLHYNAHKATGNKRVCYDDLIQELYLYMSQNDWERLRRYDCHLPFANWFSVVSYRFFKDFSRSMIDSSNEVPILTMKESSRFSTWNDFGNMIWMDIKNAISRLKPPRDKEILEALILNEENPDEVARQHGVTIDNLYNIKRRALARLIQRHLNDYK